MASTATSIESKLSPEEAQISSELAKDRPTIDAAVKSFLSLLCARDMSACMANQDTQARVTPVFSTIEGKATSPGLITAGRGQKQLALQVARAILQSCNSYEFPIHKTVVGDLKEKPGLSTQKKDRLLELSVVARLWNGLVQSQQKPTRFLGRKALLHVWSDMDVASKLAKPKEEDGEASILMYNQQVTWIEEFGQLLLRTSGPNLADDDDASLLWDSDGGQAELSRRRQRRQSAATERRPITPS